MQIRALTVEEVRTFYGQYMTDAFPRDELKPLRAMEQMMSDGRYHTWGVVDGDRITALATVYRSAPDWGLFDYLCVAPECRRQGLGAELIAALRLRERDTVLFGESELPEFARDPDMAERRLAFYRRCGAKDAGYAMTLFGVVYRVLYWSERDVPSDEIAAHHALAYRQRLPQKVYERFVTIPWSAADGAPNPVDWTEFEEDEKK